MKTEPNWPRENRRLREALREAIHEVKEHNSEYQWVTSKEKLAKFEAALSGEPVPPALTAIRISEQQWQSLAQRIKAESGWNEVSKLLDESWVILQTQQQLVTAYLGDVKWIELPVPPSAVSPQDRGEQ